ncbi:ABC transporter substrate-binding protein [Halomonas sp. I1]|uniref:ABC transporter substrate-binding protein n=1 Tax=Halomonas sp. I1 TaxID=393536 RepID=UPI0028DE4F5F|nr:ABC transporter substrate-binding protein [Halomonas sp. I1]MDT8893659.1 ABC transporter substrate-binding protein [Halomonas sp. I1]
MFSLRRSLLALGTLLLVGCLCAPSLATATEEDGTTEKRYPPLDTVVMVPDLQPMASTEPMERYRGLPSGPAVDTPSRPIAPAVAMGPAEPIAPPPVDHLDVSLDWYPSPRHAALYVAKARDMFAHRGLDVSLSTPADPEVPTKLLSDSRIDLALTRQPLLHLQVDHGMPLVRVATLVGVPLTALIVRRDTGIESPAQLKGARIGHADQDSEQILLPAMLADHDVPMDSLDTPNVHYRLEQAMQEGRVDAVIGGMRHLLPRALANDGLATRSFAVEAHGMPRHDGLILVANRNDLKRQRSAIRRFVAALEEATAWILEHPDDSWSLLTATEPTLDTPVNRDAWPEIRARLTQTPAALSQERYQAMERFLFDAGLIEAQHPVSRLAVDIGSP